MKPSTDPLPDLIFRLLGYGGLAAVAAAGLVEALHAGRLLLLGFCLIWPVCWWLLVQWQPQLRSPQERPAALAYTGECLAVMALVGLAALETWFFVAVGLLVLTGVTALGGLRLLGPCGVAVGLAAVLESGSADLERLSPATVAGAVLAFVFLVGLALTSFTRVRHLDDRRRLALSESATLRHRNTRLARYLPGEVHPLIRASPTRPNPPAEHFVTVAFVDLVGFVELVASRPLAELVDVLNDVFATLSSLADVHGGVLNKFLGDGVLICFPERSTDSADDRWRAAGCCARLCLDLGGALNELAATWRRRGLVVNVSARCGVASGYCAVGDWGSGARLDYTVIGTPVNLASRLQAQARPGGILVTAAAAALIGEDAQLVSCLGPGRQQQIRGFGASVVHELGASAKVRAIRSVGVPDHGKDLSQSLSG